MVLWYFLSFSVMPSLSTLGFCSPTSFPIGHLLGIYDLINVDTVLSPHDPQIHRLPIFSGKPPIDFLNFITDSGTVLSAHRETISTPISLVTTKIKGNNGKKGIIPQRILPSLTIKVTSRCLPCNYTQSKWAMQPSLPRFPLPNHPSSLQPNG